MATIDTILACTDDAEDRERRVEALERLRDDGRPRGQLELLCIDRAINDFRSGLERGLVWDGAEANRACTFFGLLSHWKGRQFAGNRLTLEPWQEELWIRPLFGWRRADTGQRRFSSSYVELPRKQGKSTVGAGVGLYCLVCDHEDGAEVYAAATSREQAKIVFTAAQKLASRSAAVKKHVKNWAYSIECPALSAVFRPLSSDSDSLDGLNTHCAIIDELHKHKSREMLDVLATSTGSRIQPLIQVITTAGDDRTSVCWEEHQRAGRILRGGEIVDSHHVLVVGADDEDDWLDDATLHKANPNAGVSIDFEYLKKERQKAESTPSFENTFRRNHLNQWTSQEKRWLQMHRWDYCKVQPENWPDLSGAQWFAGLDLASVSDVCALTLVCRHGGRVFLRAHYWIPADSIGDRQDRDRRQVIAWAERGLIKRLPGNTIDYELLAREVAAILKETKAEVAYDPWGPTRAFVQTLETLGVPHRSIIEFGPTLDNFAVPTREFERLVVSGELAHNGDEVLRWMAENCAVWEDGNGNKRPSKKSSGDKIDGIVAGIMGLARLMASRGPKAPAVAPRGYKR